MAAIWIMQLIYFKNQIGNQNFTAYFGVFYGFYFGCDTQKHSVVF